MCQMGKAFGINQISTDRDLEYLKGVVKQAFPRYSENGRAKLSEYYDPSRYLWSDPWIIIHIPCVG